MAMMAQVSIVGDPVCDAVLANCRNRHACLVTVRPGAYLCGDCEHYLRLVPAGPSLYPPYTGARVYWCGVNREIVGTFPLCPGVSR